MTPIPKKVMIKGFVAPQTGRYFVLLRFDPDNEATSASHKLIAKVKQSREGKKGTGTSTDGEITFAATDGTFLKADLKADGLTADRVNAAAVRAMWRPIEPVPITPKERKNKVKVVAELTAGTGDYTIHVDPAADVAFKWKLKLPKKVKADIPD